MVQEIIENKKKEITLATVSPKGKANTLAGKEGGEKARRALGLDNLDTFKGKVEVVIPDYLYAIASSFFLGLFLPSRAVLKSENDFFNHYDFKCSSSMKKQVKYGVDRCYWD